MSGIRLVISSLVDARLAKDRQKTIQERRDIDARIIVLEKKLEAQARAQGALSPA